MWSHIRIREVTPAHVHQFQHIGMAQLAIYTLKQHAGPFAFGLSLIIFVLVLDVILQMMDQVLSKGLGLGIAVELFVFNLGWIVALAVPMAVLIAVLMAFGRLSASNEIMAIKSSGISLMKIVLPVLAAGALLSVLMILFNDRVLPDWNHQARNIASSLKRRKASLVLKEKEGVFIRDMGAYSLLIRHVDKESNRLEDITVYHSGLPGPPAALHARSGELEIFEDGRYVRITLHDGEYHHVQADNFERYSRYSFARQVVHIEDPDRALSEYRSSYRSDREMDVAAMSRAVGNYRLEQERSIAFMDSSVEAFIDDIQRPVEGAAADSIDFRKRSAGVTSFLKKQWRLNNNREERANRYLVEIHKKFSIAFACIVFVLLGAPLGVLVRARGAAVSVAVSIAFFFAFWAFLIGGEQLADRGYLPPGLAMWAPNILFGLLGATLLRGAVADRLILSRLWRR